MLFFDDEPRNRDVQEAFGVLMYLVRDGVSAPEFDRAVQEWRRTRRGVGDKEGGEGGEGRIKAKGTGLEKWLSKD